MAQGEDAWRERGLVEAARAGETNAWHTLYQESFSGLYAYVLWRCGGLRDRADEVVQDVWLTAVRRLNSFVPEQGSFAAWLRGIAANVLRNEFRRPARRVQSLDGAVDFAGASTADDRELAERVARALNELPERYEAVLRAKYLEGLCVQVIAKARGETVKAVESLLTRARQAFREIYLRGESP